MREKRGQSRLVNWSGWIGLVCMLLIPTGIGLVRLGLPFFIGLGLFTLGSLVCVFLTAILLYAACARRYRPYRKATALAAIPVVPPAILFIILAAQSSQYPAIHDVTTNPDDPPAFDAAPSLRGANANSTEVNPETIAIQKKHYPDLQSIITHLPRQEAFDRATEVAESLEWHIYSADPMMGVMEASYTSEWFGFVDDIVIRFKRVPGGGTQVDLRSASRVGRGDLGANAERLRAFIQRYKQY